MLPWMTFLNAALLAGTAAFAIPLVIHLLNRSRFKTLDWGAMMFLDEALQANSRRIEWQKWLLLLLRCAIPIFLAVCMARPLLQSSSLLSTIPGGSPIATYLLIDNSLSMDAKLEATLEPSESAFALAIQNAVGLIKSASRNSRWAIDALGSRSSNPIELRTRDVVQQTVALEAIPFGSGTGDILGSLDKALPILAKSSESHRRVIVLSDFQKSMCDTIEPSQVVAMRQRYEALPNPPSIFFVPIGQTDSRPEPLSNLTVRVDRLTRSVVGIDQPWEVRLVIKNFGPEVASGLKVVLSIDGTAISSKSLDVPGRAETQLTMAMSFSEAGSHRVEAKLEVDDAFEIDNHTSWSVLVLNSISVLIIDPALKNRKQSPESDFLHAALAPFSDTSDQHSNLFRVSRMSPEELSPDVLGEHKVIMLANVPKLPDSIIEPLAEHVRSGGIMIVFSGDRIDSEWYNSRLGTVPLRTEGADTIEQRFLPYLFDRTPQSVALNEDGMKLRRENFQHPAVNFLNDTRVGSLDNLEVRRWYRLVPNANGDTDEAIALLSLVNGDAFFAQRTLGDGTILQCATTGSDRWTNWPLRPIFLPMLQNLLLNSTPPIRWQMNVETGQPLSAPSELLQAWISNGVKAEKNVLNSASARSDEAVWRLPDNRKVNSDSFITELPGFYAIENDDEVDDDESTFIMSAQAPISESNLDAESEDGLKSLADRLGATIVGSSDEIASLDTQGNRELWRWFLTGLLLLLFGELLLQRRLSGVAA